MFCFCKIVALFVALKASAMTVIDAVCENVQVLVKPRVSPSPVYLIGGVARAARVREHFRRHLARHGMALAETDPEDGLFYEALGCARAAADSRSQSAVSSASCFRPR